MLHPRKDNSSFGLHLFYGTGEMEKGNQKRTTRLNIHLMTEYMSERNTSCSNSIKKKAAVSNWDQPARTLTLISN